MNNDNTASQLANEHHSNYQSIHPDDVGRILALAKKYHSLNLLQHNILPTSDSETTITLIIKEEQQRTVVNNLMPLTPKKLITCFTEARLFDTILTLAKRAFHYTDLNEKCLHGNEQALITLVNYILKNALKYKASDIHIEPQQHTIRVRFRIDGLLHVICQLDKQLTPLIINRLKVLADCDITQHRLPQDGHFTFTEDKYVRDCRLSICPTIHGEKCVIRLLDPNQSIKELHSLGIRHDDLAYINKAIHRPQGLILVTGPTGSGKSITLYSLLHLMNQTDKNITTIENPVELSLPGVTQINTNDHIGLSFAQLLKTLLRQDPDIIMLGEIRDSMTADIAIKAASTGHLVLATLHTNNAAKSINRLLNMGIARYQIASCLNLIIAQRLARRLCPHCRNQLTHCTYCHSGFQGRIGIFEVMPINSVIRKSIINETIQTNTIESLAKENGMSTLWHSGIEHINQGITTEEELMRVIEQ